MGRQEHADGSEWQLIGFMRDLIYRDAREDAYTLRYRHAKVPCGGPWP